MDKTRMIWIGLAALIAVPVLAQTGAITPPTVKPADPAKPSDPAKPAEKAPEPTKEAVAAQAMIDAALKKIDKEIKRETNVWQFELGKRQVIVITDPVAERMRIMVPIGDATLLNQALLTRLMQANFDSALDARYAIANDVLWGTFIHPLTSLDEKAFVSGLAQAIAVADNFGGSFSSGAVVFGGGDSTKLQAQELLELLKKKAEEEKKNVI
jgi:Tir chaperone protein (CesT) family